MPPSTAAQRKQNLVKGLKEALAPVRTQATDAYQEAVALVRAFAEQVDDLIRPPPHSPGAKVTVNVELGHLVNRGQEHRVVIRDPGIGLNDHLLRAFVPPKGYPVFLDSFDESDSECNDADDLVRTLVELSKHTAMQQRLSAIRSAVADESLRQGALKKPAHGRATKSAGK